MLNPTRYDDGVDRCPDCGAIVPPAQPYGVGTIRRPCEHRAWCPFQRRAAGQIYDTAGLATVPAPAERLEDAPAPGPIWTNGLAEDDDQAEPLGYSAQELAEAQATYANALAEYGPVSVSLHTFLLAYVTGGARMRPVASHQLALMAVIDKEWTSK